jgi:diadenosine tetraphosphate (Ap4A) HIT family hydrolase/predicted house-cleaning noncanonical NTP pyrophosphatase (MazG superfamily)
MVSNKIYHNKLVRDRIPEILAENGINCLHEPIEGKAFVKALRKKLQEEVIEYFTASSQNQRTEELADILEVLYALAQEEGLSLHALEEIRSNKARAKGAFARGIFLQSTEASSGDRNDSACIFCAIGKKVPAESIAHFTHCYALIDQYPVTQGHILIIPYEHTENWFTASDAVRQDILQALDHMKNLLDAEHHPNGYNIGMNCGTTAGQSVMHLHVHLIPRYNGDVADPLGGVRGVIPEKQNYKNIGATNS